MKCYRCHKETVEGLRLLADDALARIFPGLAITGENVILCPSCSAEAAFGELTRRTGSQAGAVAAVLKYTGERGGNA